MKHKIFLSPTPVVSSPLAFFEVSTTKLLTFSLSEHSFWNRGMHAVFKREHFCTHYVHRLSKNMEKSLIKLEKSKQMSLLNKQVLRGISSYDSCTVSVYAEAIKIKPLVPSIQKVHTDINVGDKFGKLGEVIFPPKIRVQNVSKHFTQKKIERKVRSNDVYDTLKVPRIVLRQNQGGYLFLSSQAAVVVDKSGRLMTTYGKLFFKAEVQKLMSMV